MCGLHKNAGKLTSRTIKSLLLRNPIFIAILEKGGVGREIVELLSTRISANNLILFPLKWLLSSFIVSLFHKIVALSFIKGLCKSVFGMILVIFHDCQSEINHHACNDRIKKGK